MRLRSIVAFAAAVLLAACSSPPAPQAPAPESNESGRLIRVGETVAGAIEPSDPTWGGNGRFDAYRFQANAGDRILILLSSADFDPYLVVGHESGGIFDPLAQNDDAGNELNSRIRFTAPRTGTYRILAQAYDETGLGAYQLSLQPFVPSPVETTPLAVGAPVEAYLDEEDNYDEDEESHYDEYAFQAQAGRRYAITMSSEEFDSYLVLGTGSGEAIEEITSNDDSGTGYDSRILFTPEASGTYTIRARSFGGASSGAYSIRIAEAAPPGPLAVTPLTLGRTVNGTLSESDQVADDGSYFDVYSFSGRQGERVEIVMRSDHVDSYLEVGEPAASGEDFFAEFSDDDSGGNLDARIRMTLPRTGEYQVRAYALYADDTGDYTIELRENRSAPPATQPIRIGQTVRGTIDAGDPTLDDESHYELYTFEGRAGQEIRIILRSDDFDAFLQFGAWDGENVDVTYTDDDSAGGVGGLDSMLELDLTETRTYAIMANTVYGGEQGEFTLTVEED